jgi:large subunit ribosomal protein L18
MNLRKTIHQRIARRSARTRAALSYAAPRLSVHRTNRFIYAQIIDDRSMKTIAFVSSKELEKGKRTKTEEAAAVGEKLGKLAIEKGVEKAIFDRGAYRYHGRVKALAEAARKAGLKF